MDSLFFLSHVGIVRHYIIIKLHAPWAILTAEQVGGAWMIIIHHQLWVLLLVLPDRYQRWGRMGNIAKECSWLAELWSPVWLQLSWNELEHVSIAVRKRFAEMLVWKNTAWRLLKLLLVLGVKLFAGIVFVVLVEVHNHQGNIVLTMIVIQAPVSNGLSYLLKRQTLTAQIADHPADFFFREAKV